MMYPCKTIFDIEKAMQGSKLHRQVYIMVFWCGDESLLSVCVCVCVCVCV